MKDGKKNILLVAPGFYDYETLIREELQKIGFNVVFVQNRAFRNDPITVGTKWYMHFLCQKKKYISQHLLPITENKFDVCLFINLFSFDPLIIKNLKKYNPSVKCILYIWDNVKGYKWKQFFNFFDKIYSFDPVEASSLGIHYLPNFYPNFTVNSTERNDYELSFIGSLQAHRIKILEDAVSVLKSSKKSFLFYLYLHPNYDRLKYNILVNTIARLFPGYLKEHKFLYHIIARKIKYEFVHYKPLSLSESVLITARSKCIIDLPTPSQTGSTQRIIQALALGKKVMTTNASVKYDSFYDPNYIQIISTDSFYIDWDWLNKYFTSAPNVSHLRLDNWLTEILK